MARDQHIIPADWLTSTFEGRADLSRVIRRGVIEGKHLQASCEAFHLSSIIFRAF